MTSPATSIAEQLMQDVYARLSSGALPVDVVRVRRDHLTTTTRENSPAVNLEMGNDRKVRQDSCSEHRVLEAEVCIIVRSDTSHSAADPILLAVMEALNPLGSPAYPCGAILSSPRIMRPKPEIADLDALEVRIELEFAYRCAPWALGTEA